MTKWFKLEQKYTHIGPVDKLTNGLLAYKGGIVEKVGENQYKVSPLNSFGTMIIKYNPNLIDGINVLMTIEERNDNEQSLLFATKVRIEHFFIVVFFLFFLLVGGIQKALPLHIVVMVICFWMLCHIWFQWIYRKQELSAIKEITEKLIEN